MSRDRERSAVNVGLLLVVAAVVLGLAFGAYQVVSGAASTVCSTLDSTSQGCEVQP